MQLIALLFAFCLLASPVAAQSGVDVGATYFYEKGGALEMKVLNPVVAARAQVADSVQLKAGWEADVVSGASVAVVDAPGAVDVITSATKLTDFRQVPSGGITLSGETTTLSATYAYGFEKDYKSHGIGVSASAELFDRNTIFTLNYGRGWDTVCDLLQPQAQEAVERQRMPTSTGCFASGKGRTRKDLDIHSLEGGFTQNWTPIFNTQLVLSAQLLNGFQSNPYRAVWLGRAAAQEHHPNTRVRYAAGLSARVWLKPIGGALQLHTRGYRDTWNLRAISGEIAYERGIGDVVRLRVRGRYYRQTGAAFYSDDYAIDPRGAYFTGDRELSAMSSWLGGARVELLVPPGDDGQISFLDSLKFVLKGDFLKYEFGDFHYGTVSVPNDQAVFGTLSIESTF